MALFPKIQSPCPVKDKVAVYMDGDVCRLCKRQVFDLTEMSDAERIAFVRGCKDEVCVSYKISVLAAAVAIAAVAGPTAAAACEATQIVVVSMGGIKDPAHTEFVENPGDHAIPALPVVYEKAGAATKPESAEPTTPVSPQPTS